jgi:hypothetical protein
VAKHDQAKQQKRKRNAIYALKYESLRLAFSFANTLSLVVPESLEFDRLYDEHIFSAGFVRTAGSP